MQEEEASIPRQTSNRGDDGGFKSYKRLGVPGELVGDCQLHGKVAGEDKWQVGDKLGWGPDGPGRGALHAVLAHVSRLGAGLWRLLCFSDRLCRRIPLGMAARSGCTVASNPH